MAAVSPRGDGALPIGSALASVKLLLHVTLAGRYGYNGDELYFIACGRHPALGYVDHAPVVPWLARASELVLGPSLIGLRLPSALAGALAVLVTVLLCRELGGGRFAWLVTGVAMLVPPAFLRMASILCIPAFEALTWTLATLLVVRAVRREAPGLWALAGAVAGLGLLTKHTMLLWGAGMFVAVLATPMRARLRTPWPWIGAAIAALLFVPNLIWQARNDWPTLEFVRTLGRDQLEAIPRPLFVAGILLYMHPLTLPVTIAGLRFTLRGPDEAARSVGWLWIVVVGTLLVTHAKPYYAAAAFPALFAAGAVEIERRLDGRRRARAIAVAALVAGGLVTAPFALPLLPLERADATIGRLLGWAIPDPAALTLEFHEQYGWPEQVRVVSSVYRRLSPADRSRASILTRDYTQASAVAFFGRHRGLPPPISGHMTYYLWGPGGRPGDVVVAVGFERAALANLFEDVRASGRIDHRLASQWQRHSTVYTCRRPRRPLREAWPLLKRYGFGADRLRASRTSEGIPR